jgi:alkyl sulfatase BDS1-like metallo-beta-lactamase superfamily hydrolase
VTAAPGSPDWLDRLAKALSTAAPLAGEGTLRLGQLILGEDGSVRCAFTVELEAGCPPRLLGTEIDQAEVTLVESEATAEALASGAASAAELLEQGRIKVRGDAAALVRAAGLIEQLSAVTAPH